MSGELVPIGNDLESRGVEGARMSTSLDVQQQQNKLILLKCLQNCDSRITEHIGEPIVVTDYLIHDVECKNQETGEIQEAERLVLIDKDGFIHECTASTLVSSLRNIAVLFGRLPWTEGKTLIPRMKRKGKLSIYYFDIE